MMIILLIFSYSFLHLSISNEILTRDLGKDVIFSCLIEDEYQFNQVSFMHQTTGEILSVGLELVLDESNGNHHMQLSQISSNRLDLKIFSINENDSGLYTCMVNDEQLAAFFLEILIPPRFVSYYPSEASVTYPEDSSMNLSCHAFSIPPANITWIYRDQNKQSKIIHNGEDISISSVKSSSSGLYECIASNGYHATINRSFYVTIQYPPRIIKTKSIDEYQSSSVKFLCEICSMPLSNIQWIKNSKNLSNDRHYHIKTQLKSNENSECLLTMLTIHDSSHGRYGRYECRAENYLGQNSDHIDYHSKLVSKSRFDKNEISFQTVDNDTNPISSSSNSKTDSSSLISRILLFVFLFISI